MGEWTFWDKLKFRLRQVFCKHHVFTVVETHRCKKEIGYEIWCDRCHGANKQYFVQVESEVE